MAEGQVRTAEAVGALCLATDLGMGLPFGLGLGSTVVAMRLADRLAVDQATAVQTYYGCLLFYAGCTADADVPADLFPDGLTRHWAAVTCASQRQWMAGVFRALGSGDGGWVRSTVRAAAQLPRAGRGHEHHTAALCEVAEMLATEVALPPSVSGLFRVLTERWDGEGPLRRAAGTDLPLAVRIVHVARDAHFQGFLHGPAAAVEVVRERTDGAFDPRVVDALSVPMLEEPAEWAQAMEAEPRPHLTVQAPQVDAALAALTALAAFTELADVIGHSSDVAELAARAAEHLGQGDDEVAAVRRAALVHDLGKVGIPFRVWQRDGDGSGYHRGTSAAGLAPPARLLAAADAYRCAVETRHGRPGLTATDAARELRAAAEAGTLDPDAVGAVLEAAGHRPPRVARPDGLTPREEQTLALLASGMTTKQIGRTLGVTAKTADHYVQQVYAKIGVATRAAAAVYALRHGLASPATREFPR